MLFAFIRSISLSIVPPSRKNIFYGRKLLDERLLANKLLPTTEDFGHRAILILLGDRGIAGGLLSRMQQTFCNQRLYNVAEGIERRKRVAVGGDAP